MKLPGAATFVACVLLAIALKSFVMTSVITSQEKIQKLLDKGDQGLIQGIEAVISKEIELVRNLTTVLVQLSKTEKKPDFTFKVDHPNDYFLLVKHHVMNWYYSEINESLIPAVLDVIDNRNVTFPAPEDIEDAALALIRLQFVYRLKPQDMYEGNYLGYMGSPLEMEDAYVLGKKAFMAGYLPPCVEWLQLSADLLTKAMENLTKDAPEKEQEKAYSDLQSDYIWTLSLLGRAHFYMNDIKKARELYAQCEASGLANMEDADELLKELESDNITKLQEDYKPNVRDIDDNITELCSRDKEHRVSVLRPYHMCRYKSNVFIPYQRFREEILSTSPYVSLIYDAIYDAEIEWLKLVVTEKGMYREKTKDADGGNTASDDRTGDLEWVEDSQHTLVARVSQRVKAFTGLNVTAGENMMLSSAEHFQVVNYGMGGHYDVHVDKIEAWDYHDRLATVLFYLSEVEKGGATIFPKVGISVTPVKGMALLWYTFPPHLTKRDDDTLHAGCPVIIGNKWVANKWIWINGNTFLRPCGPSPESKQLDVEKIVTVDALKQIIERSPLS